MTAQEIFDLVWDHLITKESPKSMKGYECMYRGPNGTKCAVGALVTDDECKFWGSLSARRLHADKLLPKRLQEHLVLLQDLQAAHDMSDTVAGRASRLHGTAIKHGLRIP